MPKAFHRFAIPCLLMAAWSSLPLQPAIAAPSGDVAAGKLVFARCAMCHTVAAGENRLGPSLAGVIGRKAGSIAGYNYSAAMKNSGVTWTPENLDAYLANPRAKLPGVKMIFAGLPKAEDRSNVIAYLANPK